METHKATPWILRLTDILSSSVRSVEDKFIEEQYKKYDVQDTPEVIYDSIPHTYNSSEDWPASTNLHCWNCGFSFNDYPKFNPKNIRIDGESIVFDVQGNMCSFACAKTWIDTFLTGLDREISNNNLSILFFLLTGYIRSSIEPAPNHRLLLKQYGGYMDDKDFISLVKVLNHQHTGSQNSSPTMQQIPKEDRAKYIAGKIRPRLPSI